MTTTILAPIDLSATKQVGPRTFRKQILRKGQIDYPVAGGERKRIVFDDAYIADLANAYQAGAYDNVAFILADESNSHTMAPERWRGWIKGMEVTPDGLDAILELSEDAAALVVATGGKLGVSPRIKAVEHVDGRRFPRAVNHVLGTLDPRMQGDKLRLRDWEPVDLSTDSTDVLDLSGAHYTEGSTMPKIIDLSALSDEQREGLASYAAANGIDLPEATTTNPEPEPGEDPTPSNPERKEGDPAEPGEGDDEEGDEGESPESLEGLTDEEVDALIEAELAESGLALSLSNEDDDPDAVDLAAGEHATKGTEAVADANEAGMLRAQLAARDYRDAGVPPHLIDLATPILALSDDQADAIDLSSPATGEPVDVRGIVRDMLDAVKGTIDLSTETGHSLDTEDGTATDELADRWGQYLAENS